MKPYFHDTKRALMAGFRPEWGKWVQGLSQKAPFATAPEPTPHFIEMIQIHLLFIKFVYNDDIVCHYMWIRR
jgi:hypothetical protein